VKDLQTLSPKEAEVVLAVVRWMRHGPTHSSVQLHKGQNADSIKARLEVSDSMDVLLKLTKEIN
jgi:hypothetical protein